MMTPRDSEILGRETSSDTEVAASWADRVADRSPVVQRSKERSVEQARTLVTAARRLLETKGPSFTTQELIKEAGMALQTFYRCFSSKDQLLLAVIEDLIDENCGLYRERAAHLEDAIARLEFYVTATVRGLAVPRNGPSFITSEHFRLQMLYPSEVSNATQAFTDLILEEILGAVAAGQLQTKDPEYSAWLITQLTMAVFHHYDCAGLDEPTEQISQKLWEFCLAALDGPSPTRPSSKAPKRSRAGSESENGSSS
jgi:AcrR family transcriptional regulator